MLNGRCFYRHVLLALLLSHEAQAQVQPRSADASRPTLVVMLTVDQLPQRYLDTFGARFSGGLARLMRGGATFTRGFHDHATTETAPGHSTILSGRFPWSTGIVRNNAGVQDPQAPLIGARGPGASPFRFRGSTLVDWLRSRDPRSRALSVSYKDRGAILPIGRSPEEVYWYSSADGRFTTSTYYHDTLPSWVQRFNGLGIPQSYAASIWKPLDQRSAFEHALPSDTARAVRALPETPWMDVLTVQLALSGLRELRLGAGPQTDVLAISLSATDVIGHKFGPDTPEVRDQLFRLDNLLGAFLDTLFTLRDSSRVIVALTSDHGVAPLPEVHFAGQPGVGRVSLTNLVRKFSSALLARGADTSAFDFEYGMVLMDKQALQRAGVNPDSLTRAFAVEARQIPGIMRVDVVADLAHVDTTRDNVARRWRHSLPPDLPVTAVVTMQPYFYWSNITYATHGTPHDYDAHVPIMLYGAGVPPAVHSEYARVVDIAPTLAELLNVQPLEKLDGRTLLHPSTRP